MKCARIPTWFSRSQPNEWHDISYLEPARSHRGTLAATFLLMLLIAALDLFVRSNYLRSNYSILYVVPLILLARTGDPRPLWCTAGIMVALTYGVFFLKNVVNPPDRTDWSYVDLRLINRTLVAVTILGLSTTLQLWIRWREDLSDPELSESFRYQDQQISATIAVLICAPLVLLIGVTDFISPADYNLPILYPIPLFICGWTRSRRLLWSMMVVLLLLTVIAFFFGAPPTRPFPDFGLQRNRMIAIAAMFSVTVALHYWIGTEKVAR